MHILNEYDIAPITSGLLGDKKTIFLFLCIKVEMYIQYINIYSIIYGINSSWRRGTIKKKMSKKT